TRCTLLIAAPLAALLTLGTGCGGGGAPSGRSAGADKSQAPREVRLVPAGEGHLPRTVTVTGTLAADEEVTAAFKIPGRISELAVDLGSPVRKGQLLARLDATDYRHKVEQAEAALRQVRAGLGIRSDSADERVDPEKTAQVREARAVLDEARASRNRMAELLEKGFISKAEYDSSLSRLQVAEGRHQAAVEEIHNRIELLAERRSSLALAKQQLADTELRSPIDGAVRARQASVGVYLAEGAPVVALVRVHPLRLRVSVPERDASSIRVGQPVRVHPEGDAAEHTGRITRISPAIQELNRTLAIEAELPNPGGRLRPGTFARAEIEVAAPSPTVLVPSSAIVSFAGIEKVMGVKDGKAVERRVRTGRRSGDRIEILEGLAAGDPIVAEPGALAGGQPVTVKP
ncbi:MAG TPA: efflux RND transporter periplasmic adaptor subunit, partial [Candidatus Deferrimicrobiaceae bacterium]